jgi:molecular chaperone GrpE
MSKKKQKEPVPEPEIPVEEEETAAEAASPEQQYAELNDRYLRLMAEYENYRKRSTKEKTEIYPAATASAVEKFLPVLDNFERAAAFERTTEDFAKGFDMIYESLENVLKNLGVEVIGEEGEPFNPDLHNAVMQIQDPKLGENVVARVLQKGYKIGDRVIRYAMVQTAN